MSEENRERFALAPEAEGAVVADVPAQLASDCGLNAGDVVTEVAYQRIRSLDDLENRLAELRRMARPEALLTVQDRNGGVRFATLQLDE